MEDFDGGGFGAGGVGAFGGGGGGGGGGRRSTRRCTNSVRVLSGLRFRSSSSVGSGVIARARLALRRAGRQRRGGGGELRPPRARLEVDLGPGVRQRLSAEQWTGIQSARAVVRGWQRAGRRLQLGGCESGRRARDLARLSRKERGTSRDSRCAIPPPPGPLSSVPDRMRTSPNRWGGVTLGAGRCCTGVGFSSPNGKRGTGRNGRCRGRFCVSVMVSPAVAPSAMRVISVPQDQAMTQMA